MPDQAEVALAILREVEDVLGPMAGAASDEKARHQAARARALLNLVRLLQLHLLGGWAGWVAAWMDGRLGGRACCSCTCWVGGWVGACVGGCVRGWVGGWAQE